MRQQSLSTTSRLGSKMRDSENKNNRDYYGDKLVKVKVKK